MVLNDLLHCMIQHDTVLHKVSWFFMDCVLHSLFNYLLTV